MYSLIPAFYAAERRGIDPQRMNYPAASGRGIRIEIKPEIHYGWRNRGYVLTKLNRYREAFDSFEKALKIAPASSGTYYWKSYLFIKQLQPDLAIESLKKAIELSASHKEFVKTDPDFDLIREDDRFKQLIEE
jgi:tetratricopeptide (TPR) repeat protein